MKLNLFPKGSFFILLIWWAFLTTLETARALNGCGNGSTSVTGDCPTCHGGDDSGDNSSGGAAGGSNIINTYTGNANRDAKDLQVWGSVGKIPLVLSRWNNSRTPDVTTTVFGQGGNWSHSYQFSLTSAGTQNVTNPATGLPQAEGVINFSKSDGSVYRFIQQAVNPNLYLPAASLGIKLTVNQSVYTIQTANGHTYNFQSSLVNNQLSFRFISLVDEEGIVYSLSYDSNGLLTKVTDPTGRYLAFTYQSLAVDSTHALTVISKISTADGREADYQYSLRPDAALNTSWALLTSVTYGDGTRALYSYGQTNPDTRPVLIEAVDPRITGKTTHVIYDYFSGTPARLQGMVLDERDGNTEEIIASVGYDDAHTPYALYPNGRKVTYWMDASHNANLVQMQDGLGNITKNTYDNGGSGFLSSKTDPNGHTTSFTSSTFGNPLGSTLPDGTVETWIRDSLDLVLNDTLSGPGISTRVTTYTRDSQHRVIRKTYPDNSYETFAYNPFNEVLSHQLRNGGVETSVFDPTGLKTSMTDAVGNLWKYSYDGSSRLASLTDPRGNKISYQYTERGLPTQTTFADGSSTIAAYDDFGDRIALTNEIGNTWHWTYDTFKRVTTANDPLNRTTQTYYTMGSAGGGGCSACNTDNKPTKIVLPSGKETDYYYDVEWRTISTTVGAETADAATTKFFYDPVGNRTKVTDPRGYITSLTYDNRNRKITSTDPNSNTTQWSYDATSNVLTTTRPDNGVISNTYDSMNRMTATTDPKNEKTGFTYDNADNLLTLQDANGTVTKFAYDLLNRQTKKTYTDGTFASWTYIDNANASNPSLIYKTPAGQTELSIMDVRNRVTHKNYSDATPSVATTYDNAGRALTVTSSVCALSYTYDLANELLSEKQAIIGLSTTPTVAYTYDSDGNSSSLQYPDGTVVSYGYTNRNQLSTITAAGYPGSTNYTYDLAGNRVTKTIGNGVTTSYAYDPASRLLTLNNQIGNSLIAGYGYTYNTVDNRLSMIEAVNGASTSQNYAYDSIDQVISVNYGTGRSESFVYDPVGNRQQSTDTSQAGPTAYKTNTLNQYLSISNLQPASLSYDLNGNLSKTGVWTYGHDSLNRFASAISTGTSPINESLAYDAHNRCVKRTINGVLTYYIYDNWSLIAEYQSSGALTQKYLNGAKIDEILAKTKAGQSPIYYLQDGLGSTVALTDSTGELVEHYRYDVYGEVSIFPATGLSILPSSAYGNRFMFTGREYLPELNLYDYRNRKYLAESGRWLERDPIGERGGINLYAYCENDPINSVDAHGLDPIPVTKGNGKESGGAGSEFVHDFQKYVERKPPAPGPRVTWSDFCADQKGHPYLVADSASSSDSSIGDAKTFGKDVVVEIHSSQFWASWFNNLDSRIKSLSVTAQCDCKKQ